MKIRDNLFIILLIVIDQLTKLYISSVMTLGQSIRVITDFFYITYARNTGAAFSILEGQKYFFIASALLAVAAIIWYLNKNSCSFWEKLGLMLIASGAVGNVIDRIRFSEVIDFLDFYIFGYDFPIFNFADCCITVGAAIVVLSVLLERKKEA
ncbi:MAG: signal peptidase II [Erysipelotrichaceae bacterium]|nr:signal peptidase II [Erysipelotrichaceae bacterium]